MRRTCRRLRLTRSQGPTLTRLNAYQIARPLMPTHHFDVAVIGGGSGLTAAYYARQDDRSVALIEAKPDALGGTCQNRGCIPTKGLIRSADVARLVRKASNFGVDVPLDNVKIDFPRIIESIEQRRQKHSGKTKEWVDSDMTPFYSRVRFTDESTLKTDDGETITAERFFVCSGARPKLPTIDGLDTVPFLTNESALRLEKLPQSIMVLGGGYIGCEFAHFFAALGTEVHVVHPHDTLLNHEDADIARVFTEAFGERAKLHLGCRAKGFECDSGRVTAKIVPGGDESKAYTQQADRLLIATGRTPNTDTLGLDAAGIRINSSGWIEVNKHLQTSNPNVYAYGDCIGQAMFKHTSSYEGMLAYRNAFADSAEKRRAVDYDANPHAVFAEPEIASVGMTEARCEAAGLDFTAESIPYASIAKSEIMGSPEGLAKGLVEKASGCILGCHIAGPHAAILIQEVVTAMHHGLPASAIRDAIHIHPAMPELVQKLFSKLAG